MLRRRRRDEPDWRAAFRACLALLAFVIHTTVPARAIVVCAGEDGTRNVEFAHTPGACAHLTERRHEHVDDHEAEHGPLFDHHAPEDHDCHGVGERCCNADHDHGCEDAQLAADCLLTQAAEPQFTPDRWTCDLANGWWISALSETAELAQASAEETSGTDPYHSRTVVMTC